MAVSTRVRLLKKALIAANSGRLGAWDTEPASIASNRPRLGSRIRISINSAMTMPGVPTAKKAVRQPYTTAMPAPRNEPSMVPRGTPSE